MQRFGHPLCTKPNRHITGNFFPSTRLLWVEYTGDNYGVRIDSTYNVINQYDLHEIAMAKWEQMSDYEKEDNPFPGYDPFNVLENNGRDKQLKSLCEWIGARFKYAADMVYCYYEGNTYGIVPYKPDHIYNQFEMARIHSAMRQHMLVNNMEDEIKNVPYYRPTRYDPGYIRFNRMCEYMGAKYLGVLEVSYSVHKRDRSLDKSFANNVIEARFIANIKCD
jgi:hypothetical protein